MGNRASHHVVEKEADFDELYVEPSTPLTESELRARQINPAEHEFPFENIVLEGGGSKGMAYCGAIRALEDIGLFPQIKRFAGTSAGAIMAALLTVGYTSHDVEKFMKNDMSKNFMLDGSRAWRILTFLPRFMFGYGLSPATHVNDWLGEKLRNKTGSADITFEQLYNMCGKELCILVTNVNNMAAEYCHPKTTPDMPVRLAVRMSMSIPGMFQVVKYSPYSHLPPNMYIDGGILCNYPIHCFDGWWLSMKPEDTFVHKMRDLNELPAILSKASRFGERSDKTLGFLVYSEGEADSFRYYLEKRTPVQSRFSSRLSSMRRTEQRVKHRDRQRIVAAVNRLLPLMDQYEENHDGKISRQEFQNIYDHFSEEDRKTLFGDEAECEEIFKRLDRNGNGEVTLQEVGKYIEQRGLAVNQRYLGYQRQDVTSIVSYASTIFNTMLLNLKRLYMEYDDLERTVGINTGHVETADFDLEEEDVGFMLEQGRKATMEFLQMYVVKKKKEEIEVSA
ncbi:uncharacterized protein LOC132550396 isoform X2 [Ylistrum balloti]|nr:uncharacterized protein LOC132550396 isoform X2 [Ylistrum balloti]